jgi:putative DNA primase/helicase
MLSPPAGDPITDPDEIQATLDVWAHAMRLAKDDTRRLLAIETASSRLARFGDAAIEAIDYITEVAIYSYNLDADDVQNAIAKGMQRTTANVVKIKRGVAGEAQPEPAKANAAASAPVVDGVAIEAPLFSDEYLALVFANRHQDDTRFVATAWGRWVTWQQTYWRPDRTLVAFDRARALCRDEAAKVKKGKMRMTLASARTVAAVERLAKADRKIAADVEQFDTGLHLFNTAGGTVDLLTGIQKEHDPFDYITKIAAEAPKPEVEHPLWSNFLDTVTAGDADLIEFLQRYMGYCMTGHTTEQVLVFLYGKGGNGKGVFIKTVSEIFGDYAVIAPMELLIASDNDRHPTEIAKLMGARLVVAQETQEGRRWDESKIKTLTGSDKLTGRFMRQDFFDFTPQFKLLIAGNHMPSLRNVDEAIKRRFLLVPFIVHIDKPDKDLFEKLKSEWPAILRWMIAGCLKWRESGLMVPKIVRDASDKYFASEDILTQWIDEALDRRLDDKTTRTHDLFFSWKTWCEPRNYRPGSEKSFIMRMEDKGFRKKLNNARQAVFEGVAFRG